ncbi:amidohydrolase family protein [Robertkochia solimangrovi]|uniref:amidohydrolase family protein n=1 Tax=Robertkochia solimangrovi TaxID=2213046 RepID=UPI00117D368B|nr:amidohydrolase family protein [Robertkochia solimangrovi]TRZ41177.1 amidohydrolase [Robertkochia solimangrovi]
MKRFNLLLLCLAALPLSAQDKKEDKKEWDVSAPGKDFNYQTHKFTTEEGTWMNLDVSPDGKTIVFDLLGDIYTIPVTGGKAKALRTGIPYEVQPRFSPDGKHISFTSDAGGGDNVWVMNSDGSEARQLTKESFRLLNNADWTPDGNFLIARKHFTSGRSLGAGEMWQYHITGGSGLQLTKRKNDQQDVNEPNVSPDGRYLYYSEDVYPGGAFEYNKDPNKQIYVIKRYDFKTGETTTVTGGPGGAARPAVSPDGKKLAFVKRVRTKTVLFIQDLETGQEYPVYDGLSKDQQEAWAIFGVYPNYDWMPDGRSLVFWSDGKIHSLNTETLAITDIPFTVDVAIDIAETLHFSSPVTRDTFEPKTIRQAVTSPDGKYLVFHALGYIWKKKLPNGKPERITSENDFEFEPSFSPDGRSLVFVTWNDIEKGSIKQTALNSKADPVTLSQGKAIYRTPSYSPDGKKIVFRKESGNTDQGTTFTKDPGVYLMNSDGSGEIKLTGKGEYPIFNTEGNRIFLQTGGTYFGALTKELISVNLQGEDERTHVKSKYANRLVPSPDNKFIAYSVLHKAYVAPLVLNGHTIDLDNKSDFVPVRQIAKDAGINLHWSPDSKTVMWTLGATYYSQTLSETFKYLNGGKDVEDFPAKETSIRLEADVDKPEGVVAFTNARIITMEGDEVIENGTIVVNGDEIISVGPAAEVKVPSNAKVYDATGKTIMPGMVDAHAHIGAFRYGLTTTEYWPFITNLAFGVTTAHDPSANTETVFTLSEMQKSGALVGPRLYSTGFILYGADGDFKAVINGLEDAESSIRRTKAFGAKSVKSYNQPRRDQRQQVIQAAREMQINVVPEGGSTFFHNMTQVIDGHSGIEHNIPVAPLYKDVIELWSASGSGYTPTLIVNYAGMSGEYFFYQHYNVWENEKLLRFTPRGIIDSRARHRIMVPEEEYKNGHILVSEQVNKLAEAGVKVNMGAHGQIQGIGAHWETWMLVQGGMSNHNALKAATINGANYIGAGNDIGSLKAGKLADLIVLSENPLDDIHNTESIEKVMVNGRLYDTETMNEIGNYDNPRPPLYFEVNGYNNAFEWHESSNSFMRGGCSCHLGHQ